jgi:hypothetical protein
MTLPKTEIRRILVPMTDEEKAKIGTEAAGIDKQIAQLEKEKKASAQDFKAQIESLQSEKAPLVDALNMGNKYVDVECVWNYDFDAMKKTLVAPSGDVLDTLPISEYERKRKIEEDIENAKGSDDAPDEREITNGNEDE